MNKYYTNFLILLVLILAVCGCNKQNFSPDDYSTEPNINIEVLSLIDTISPNELVIDLFFINSNLVHLNKIGHCWNTDTEIIPTLKSEVYLLTVWEPYSLGINQLLFRYNVPIPYTMEKINIRGFVEFNDSIVRYSDVLTIFVPDDYAN